MGHVRRVAVELFRRHTGQHSRHRRDPPDGECDGTADDHENAERPTRGAVGRPGAQCLRVHSRQQREDGEERRGEDRDVDEEQPVVRHGSQRGAAVDVQEEAVHAEQQQTGPCGAAAVSQRGRDEQGYAGKQHNSVGAVLPRTGEHGVVPVQALAHEVDRLAPGGHERHRRTAHTEPEPGRRRGDGQGCHHRRQEYRRGGSAHDSTLRERGRRIGDVAHRALPGRSDPTTSASVHSLRGR